MALTSTLTPRPHASRSDISASDKHCVFRCGDAWFSVPAVAVRQLVVTPEIVKVPHCHRALVGLGRLRGEFVPIVALGRLLDIDPSNQLPTGDCLLVLEGKCVWSLLISESIALESLETIVSQEAKTESNNNVAIGTAMFQDRIVRVLNPSGLLARAQCVLDQYWSRAEVQPTLPTLPTERNRL
ncbi:MAG: chemotaxis protein CheW [Pirellulaceae bacterium]|jgi:chemotaxis signal transduction protein